MVAKKTQTQTNTPLFLVTPEDIVNCISKQRKYRCVAATAIFSYLKDMGAVKCEGYKDRGEVWRQIFKSGFLGFWFNEWCCPKDRHLSSENIMAVIGNKDSGVAICFENEPFRSLIATAITTLSDVKEYDEELFVYVAKTAMFADLAESTLSTIAEALKEIKELAANIDKTLLLKVVEGIGEERLKWAFKYIIDIKKRLIWTLTYDADDEVKKELDKLRKEVNTLMALTLLLMPHLVTEYKKIKGTITEELKLISTMLLEMYYRAKNVLIEYITNTNAAREFQYYIQMLMPEDWLAMKMSYFIVRLFNEAEEMKKHVKTMSLPFAKPFEPRAVRLQFWSGNAYLLFKDEGIDMTYRFDYRANAQLFAKAVERTLNIAVEVNGATIKARVPYEKTDELARLLAATNELLREDLWILCGKTLDDIRRARMGAKPSEISVIDDCPFNLEEIEKRLKEIEEEEERCYELGYCDGDEEDYEDDYDDYDDDY